MSHGAPTRKRKQNPKERAARQKANVREADLARKGIDLDALKRRKRTDIADEALAEPEQQEPRPFEVPESITQPLVPVDLGAVAQERIDQGPQTTEEPGTAGGARAVGAEDLLALSPAGIARTGARKAVPKLIGTQKERAATVAKDLAAAAKQPLTKVQKAALVGKEEIKEVLTDILRGLYKNNPKSRTLTKAYFAKVGITSGVGLLVGAIGTYPFAEMLK